MDRLFDEIGGKVVISVKYKGFKDFENLLSIKDGGKWIKYVYYMTCYNLEENPFINMPDDMRENVILEQLSLSKDSLDRKDVIILEKALELGMKIYETPIVRLYKQIKRALDKIGRYFEDIVVNDKNYKDVVKTLKEYSEIREVYKISEKDLLDEINQGKIRGNKARSYDL